MKKLILALFIGAFALTAFQGCRAKKETTEKTEIKEKEKDSTAVNTDKTKETEKTPAIIDTVYIDKPCDEAGKLKPFHNVYNTGRGRVEVFTDSLGRIQVIIDIPEQTQVKENNNRSEYREKETAKEKKVDGKQVIEVIPFRYYIWLVAACLASLLFLALFLWALFRKRT